MGIAITFMGINSPVVKVYNHIALCQWGAECCFSAGSEVHTYTEELERKHAAILTHDQSV